MSHKIRVAFFLLFGCAVIAAIIFLSRGDFLKQEQPVVMDSPVSDNNIAPEQDQPETSPELSSGMNILFQKTSIKDPGTQDWANDDTGLTQIYAYNTNTKQQNTLAEIPVPPERGGSIVTYPYGPDLLVHRYGNEGDAILSLDGKVEEIPSTWNKIRSTSGQWEVESTTVYDRANLKTGFYVLNRSTGESRDINLDPLISDELKGQLSPVFIDDAGKAVLLIQQYGSLEGLPQGGSFIYNLATNSLQELSSLSSFKDILETEHIGAAYPTTDRTYTTSFDVDHQMILLTTYRFSTENENEMGGNIPLGPSRVYLIDVAKNTSRLALESQDFYLANARLSPDGTSIACGYSANPDAVWVTKIGEKAVNSDMIVSGTLIDWVGNTLVVQRGDDLLLYDLTPGVAQPITVLGHSLGAYQDTDYARYEYIGHRIVK